MLSLLGTAQRHSLCVCPQRISTPGLWAAVCSSGPTSQPWPHHSPLPAPGDRSRDAADSRLLCPLRRSQKPSSAAVSPKPGLAFVCLYFNVLVSPHGGPFPGMCLVLTQTRQPHGDAWWSRVGVGLSPGVFLPIVVCVRFAW